MSATRVAAVADVHARHGDTDRVRDLLGGVGADADVLVLAGDLTDHGYLEEAEALEEGLSHLDIPVLGVFGNHDHESGSVHDVRRVLERGGVRILDRGEVIVEAGIGFCGVKGFCGGFGERIVRAFGEDALKSFVTESIVEAEALREGLKSISDVPRMAVLHFAPVVGTVQGEPPEIHPFLGTSRLAEAIDGAGAHLAVHGHAHHGAHEGRTAGGVPVYNVSLPVLRNEGAEKAYRVFEVDGGGVR